MSIDSCSAPGTAQSRNTHKMLAALERLACQKDKGRAMPILARSLDLERLGQQEVEDLKKLLASENVSVPASVLEKGVVLPHDVEPADHPGYPDRAHLLYEAPFPLKTLPKRKPKKERKSSSKKSNKSDGGNQGKSKFARRMHMPAIKYFKPGPGLKLQQNAKLEYKVFEYGNYPTLRNGKPRAGMLRLMLPADADWNVNIRTSELNEEDLENIREV